MRGYSNQQQHQPHKYQQQHHQQQQQQQQQYQSFSSNNQRQFNRQEDSSFSGYIKQAEAVQNEEANNFSTFNWNNQPGYSAPDQHQQQPTINLQQEEKSTTKSNRRATGEQNNPYQQQYLPSSQSQASTPRKGSVGLNRSSNSPIQVMIRVRPQYNPANVSALRITDATSLLVSNNENVHQFKFARVFKPVDTQETVFTHVCEPILNHALNGFNASFLVYGQTGTGKTHTMGLHQNNLEQEPGMIEHSLRYLFTHCEQSLDPDDWQISMSFMQIYIEEIFDLLNPNGQKLQIREDPESSEVYVQDLITVPIKNLSQALKLIEAGLHYRTLGAQDMNSVSSRSHTILNVYLQQKISQSEYVVSTIAFVDLAGSERIKKSNSTGLRMEEAKKINSSLSALSNVISLLGQSTAQFIPYRDSKLTRILQNCLNGQSKISLVGTLEPSEDNSFESYSTLLFASRCQDITFLPQSNISNVFTLELDPQEQIDALRQELSLSQAKLKRLESSQSQQLQQSTIPGGINQANSGNHSQSPSPTSSSSTSSARAHYSNVLETMKKVVDKLSISMNESSRHNRQSQNNSAAAAAAQLIAAFPYQELKRSLAEDSNNIETEFIEGFETAFEQIVQSYAAAATINTSNSSIPLRETNSNVARANNGSSSTTENHNVSQLLQSHLSRTLKEMIEFTTAIAESATNQLRDTQEQKVLQNLTNRSNSLESNEVTRLVSAYQVSTVQKLRSIVFPKESSQFTSNSTPQLREISALLDYLEKPKERQSKMVIQKFTKSELQRIKELSNSIEIAFIEAAKSSNESSCTNNNEVTQQQATSTPTDSNGKNSNIKDFLFKQKQLNDSLFLAVPPSHRSINTSSSSSSSFLMNEMMVSKRNASVTNVATARDISDDRLNGARKLDTETEQKRQIRGVSSIGSHNSNGSASNTSMNNNQINNAMNLNSKVVAGTSSTVHVKRIKILDEDINPQEGNDNHSKKIVKTQQSSQPRRPEVQVDSFSTKERNSVRRLEQFNTNTMSPIPQEQTLNTQLKSANFSKKFHKYAPFHDA